MTYKGQARNSVNVSKFESIIQEVYTYMWNEHAQCMSITPCFQINVLMGAEALHVVCVRVGQYHFIYNLILIMR